MTSKLQDETLIFEFTNHIKTEINPIDENELFFIDMYLEKLLGEFENPNKKVGIVAEYDTLKILLASMIKNYNSFLRDRFVDTRVY